MLFFRALPSVQVKKQEIRGMLTDIDKEGAASVSFNDFVEMVTPKVLARDPKVRERVHALAPRAFYS